jgi:hypothetical protein
VENNNISYERRESDRQALDMVVTLTERIASLIKRFDDYGIRQEKIQTTVADKLEEHEKLVIRGMTSWKWIALLSGIVAGGIVLSYTEFITLKDSVLKHHTEWEIRKQYQDEINTRVVEQLKELREDGHKNAP